MKLFVWGQDGWYQCVTKGDYALGNLRLLARYMGLCTAWVKR